MTDKVILTITLEITKENNGTYKKTITNVKNSTSTNDSNNSDEGINTDNSTQTSTSFKETIKTILNDSFNNKSNGGSKFNKNTTEYIKQKEAIKTKTVKFKKRHNGTYKK